MLLNIKTISVGVSILASAIPIDAYKGVAYNWIPTRTHHHQIPAINKFHPWLRVDQGCVPFPAVADNEGGWFSTGLKTTGAINGGCGSSGGQVYVRTLWVNGSFGMYYAWYFPKDQIALGPAGHPNDWEGVVVWVDNEGSNSKLRAVCPARHGTDQGDYHCDRSNFYTIDGRPRIVYRPDGPSTHAVFTGASETSGYSDQPIQFWDWLPEVCRQMLNDDLFGSAQFPAKDWNFVDNMWKSARAAGLA